jgi:hypothetical protein
VFPIVSEPLDISLEFLLSMAVAADSSLELLVQAFGNRMLHLKTEDVAFRAAETTSGITHLLAA